MKNKNKKPHKDERKPEGYREFDKLTQKLAKVSKEELDLEVKKYEDKKNRS